MDLILKTRYLGYNIFYLNDSFYNDICSRFNYNNSDFSLSERKNLLDLSNENLTIPGCNFTGFDIKTIRIIYLCKIGNDINNNNVVSEVNIIDNDEDNNLNNFKKNTDFSKASNIKIFKCFSIFYNSKLFLENYGFYIMLFTTILIILLLIFSFPNKLDKQLKIFCNIILSQMKKIYSKKQNEKNLKINDGKNENTKVVNDKINDIDNSNSLSDDNSSKNENIDISKIENIKEIRSNSSQRDLNNKIKNNPNRDINQINKDSSINEKIKIDISNNHLNNLDNINNGKNKSNYNGEDEHKIIDKLRKKNDSNLYLFYIIKYIPLKKRKKYISEYEMENLSYEYALEIEDRNKSDIYFSLLREKNKIISIALNDKDFNIHTVKIALFIFNFNLSLAINALFFTDEAIYKINQDEGSFNLSTQISRIIYSAIISAVISYIVEFLGFTHNSIIKLRYLEDIKKAEDRVPKILRILKIRIMVFFIIIIFFDIIFFYYITVFCSIYSIIQIHMIKDSLISFLLTNSYSIILYLLASFIRVFSLKKKSKFRHILYMISWIITLI